MVSSLEEKIDYLPRAINPIGEVTIEWLKLYLHETSFG